MKQQLVRVLLVSGLSVVLAGAASAEWRGVLSAPGLSSVYYHPLYANPATLNYGVKACRPAGGWLTVWHTNSSGNLIENPPSGAYIDYRAWVNVPGNIYVRYDTETATLVPGNYYRMSYSTGYAYGYWYITTPPVLPDCMID